MGTRIYPSWGCDTAVGRLVAGCHRSLAAGREEWERSRIAAVAYKKAKMSWDSRTRGKERQLRPRSRRIRSFL